MKETKKHQHWWLLILIGSLIPLMFILKSQLSIPERFILPIIVVIALVSGAMALWMHANANATGDEWWQDNSSSGWRGY